jgi:hypothetical protein
MSARGKSVLTVRGEVAKAAQVALPDEQPAAAEQAQPEPTPVAPVLSASDRENPNKLSGEPLRALAHRRGLARSQLPSMSDEKIREQLRYMTYNQYENDAVA